jgi:hypothetical protein
MNIQVQNILRDPSEDEVDFETDGNDHNRFSGGRSVSVLVVSLSLSLCLSVGVWVFGCVWCDFVSVYLSLSVCGLSMYDSIYLSIWQRVEHRLRGGGTRLRPDCRMEGTA